MKTVRQMQQHSRFLKSLPIINGKHRFTVGSPRSVAKPFPKRKIPKNPIITPLPLNQFYKEFIKKYSGVFSEF